MAPAPACTLPAKLQLVHAQQAGAQPYPFHIFSSSPCTIFFWQAPGAAACPAHFRAGTVLGPVGAAAGLGRVSPLPGP